MDFEVVEFVSRWLHITAAAAAAGGALFMRLAFQPASETLPEEPRRNLREAVRARWSKVVTAAVALLLLTGTYNLLISLGRFEWRGTPYHALLGVKLLLALTIFFLASVLVGRSEFAQRLRRRGTMWTTVLVGLFLTLLALSSALKTLPHREKSPPASSAPSSPSTARAR